MTASCSLAFSWSDFSSSFSSKAKFSAYVTAEGSPRQGPMWQVLVYKGTLPPSTLPIHSSGNQGWGGIIYVGLILNLF